MTISTDTTKQTFLGNGAQTIFSFSFLVPTLGQYELWFVDAGGAASLIDQANYTVAGVGNPSGGTVTYAPGGSPIASGTSITFTRAVPYTQDTNLSNQGAYYPQSLERGLDRLEMQIQQLNTILGGAFRVGVTDPAVDPVPTVAERANTWAVWGPAGELTSSALNPPFSPIGALEITGAQSLAINPVANPLDTYASLYVSGETLYDDAIEFLAAVGFTSSKGAGASSPERNKVALYVGMDAVSGTGDAWALNTVTTMGAGAALYTAFGYELDFNNLNGHRGNTDGAAGLAAPSAYGQAITGVASYRSTGALLITGTGSIWNRGIVVSNGVVQSAFQDFSGSQRSLDIRGVYSVAAIDLTGSVSAAGAAMRIPNNHAIYGNTTGGSTVVLAGVTASDQVLLGQAGLNTIVDGASVQPVADGLSSLGRSGYRWSEVWAANGTIQTSDLRAKRDISIVAADAAMDMVRAVKPISYRMAVGGGQVVAYTAEGERQVTRKVAVEREITETVDGRVVARAVREEVDEPVFDEVPVLDEAGKQIVDWAKPVYDRERRVIRPGQWVPRTLAVPRMEPCEVQATRVDARPGRRMHLGFAASEIRAAAQEAGIGDVGAYVVGDDGTEGLRHDQLTAVLWAAVRRLDERLQAVEK